MKTILVTGGAGFIGSHLTKRLIKSGYSVVCVDNFNSTNAHFAKWEKVASYRNHPRYRLLSIDIRDQNVLTAAMQEHGVDAVIHLAALVGVRPSIRYPGDYVNTNIGGTLSVLDSMRQACVGKLVFASSSSVYGSDTPPPFREDAAATRPFSPYALTKRTAEMLCENYFYLHGIETFCLRFFTVYGPGQRPDMAISRFLTRVMYDLPIDVYGDGTSSRDYTYVDDIVNGIVSALLNVQGYEVFNLGSSRVFSINKLIETIELVVGKKAIVHWLSDQPGDVPITHADITKANVWLAYAPETSLWQGLQNMVEFMSCPEDFTPTC